MITGSHPEYDSVEMLDAFEARWEEEGLTDRLHMERFQPIIGGDGAGGEGGTIKFLESEIEAESDGSQPILVAGEEAGAELPFGCRMGICHTCVGKLCSGRLRDMRSGAALRVHHHLIMAQSMAFQNATWLVETAKAGYEDGFRMFGHSVIVAPTGEIAVKSQSEEDEVICYNCDIDLAANLKKTMFNFAAHRRPEHYRLIVDRVGAEVTPAND